MARGLRRAAAGGLLLWGFAAAAPADFVTPDWLYPISEPAAERAARPPAAAPLRLAGSAAAFTSAQLHDMYTAVDWRPQSHPAMPEIVAHGRPPAVYACGYCHLPAGQGRPENAALAGLPADYIVRQLQDYRSGARRSGGPAAYFPGHAMSRVAAAVTDAEIRAAADYFSRLPLAPRVRVVESATVPAMRVAGWVYVPVAGAPPQPLGQRLLETVPDLERHERRDDRLLYLAYAPPGSIARGKALAADTCGRCHGPDLQGAGTAPPLAGRPPSYLLRQLAAFRSGARAGAAGQPMTAVSAGLSLDDMIAAAAYAASLPPRAAAMGGAPPP